MIQISIEVEGKIVGLIAFDRGFPNKHGIMCGD